MMFHASRRPDFQAPGILEAPPAERSVTPKCTETKQKLNGGQHVCNFEEKRLLKAHFLGGYGECIKFSVNKAEKWELFTIKEITTTVNPVWLGAIRSSVSSITTI